MAKTKDFWFKFYPQKWLAGTAFMTFEERGFYLHLLMLQHQSGHIPEKTVRFLLGSSSVSVWDTVSEKFVQDEHGNYYNEFLEEQIAERAKNSETNVANGSLGGRPRKDKTETKPNGYDLGSENSQNKNRNETQTKTESNSISNSNNSTVEHSYKEGVAVTYNQGGAGGNGIQPQPLDHLTVTGATMRMITQYGATGRQPNKTSIGAAIRQAVTFCMNERPEQFPTARDAILFLETQAGKAKDFDQRAKNDKRKGLERWLNELCFSDDIDLAEIASAGKNQSWKDTVEKF